MGTVGINFGSATGGSGFDVAASVTSILAVSSAIETPWKTQLTNLQAQDAAFTTLGTDLSTLSTALAALTNFDGVLASKQGASSATNLLTLTAASSAAVAGSHTIEVARLAATSSIASSSVPSLSDTLSGSLSIAVGASGSPKTILIDATNNTLAGIAQTINSGAYGVNASVITDRLGSRLSLVSQTSGSSGEVSVGGTLLDTATSGTLSFATTQSGQDAQLTVDGLATTSASNTVTGAIPGVTFQLLASSPGTAIQVQITNDNASVETAAQALVSAYNTVVHDIKTQTGKTTSGVAGALFGNPTLSQLQSQLSSSLFSGASSGLIGNLQQLGFSAEPDGTLSLSVSDLDAALNANFSDVVGFFQNQGSFGQSFRATLDGLSSTSTTGLINLALEQNSSTESGLTQNVTNEDALLATEKINLTKELNIANEELQSIPQQLLEVNQIYSAITGYNTSR